VRIEYKEGPEDLVRHAAPFPKIERVLQYGPRSVIEYLTSTETVKAIYKLTEEINLGEYHHIIVNASGGSALSNMLSSMESIAPNFISVAVRRDENGSGIRIDSPLPSDLKGRVLIMEDILDTGKTLKKLTDYCPHADIDVVVAVLKAGVEDQIPIHRYVNSLHVAIFAPNGHWYGGIGMDFGKEENNFGRTLTNVVAKRKSP